MAAPTFVDSAASSTGAGNGTSLSFAWANLVGLATDDLVIAVIYRETVTAYSAQPSGWTQVSGFPQDQSSGGLKYRCDVWWKRFAADSGTITWSWTGSDWRNGMWAAWRGAITTETPIVTVGFDAEVNQNDQPSNPGITVARNNSALMWAVWNFDGNSSTPPSGFTERGDAGEVEMADDLTTTTGATGTVAGVFVNPEWPSSVLLEIASEAAAGGATPSRLAILGVG